MGEACTLPNLTASGRCILSLVDSGGVQFPSRVSL